MIEHLGLLLLTSFTSVDGDGLRLEFDAQMRSRVVAVVWTATCRAGTLHVLGNTAHRRRASCATTSLDRAATRRTSTMRWAQGIGRRAHRPGGSVIKRVEVDFVSGPSALAVHARALHERRHDAARRCSATSATATSSQPGREPARTGVLVVPDRASYESRPDWLLPLRPDYAARQLPRHEHRRLRRRHAGARCMAPRRRAVRSATSS